VLRPMLPVDPKIAMRFMDVAMVLERVAWAFADLARCDSSNTLAKM
jgi:hypothetical protein